MYVRGSIVWCWSGDHSSNVNWNQKTFFPENREPEKRNFSIFRLRCWATKVLTHGRIKKLSSLEYKSTTTKSYNNYRRFQHYRDINRNQSKQTHTKIGVAKTWLSWLETSNRKLKNLQREKNIWWSDKNSLAQKSDGRHCVKVQMWENRCTNCHCFAMFWWRKNLEPKKRWRRRSKTFPRRLPR